MAKKKPQKPKKVATKKEKPTSDESNDHGGIPDVDLKKMMGCGG